MEIFSLVCCYYFVFIYILIHIYMNDYLYYNVTDIIEIFWILITYLIYLLQVTTDFPITY